MKFKLDENFGTRTLHLFVEAGHDVRTVRQQELQGASDMRLFNVCLDEERCLVTLDLDFADVIRFAPTGSAGIAVIRLPKQASLSTLESLVTLLLRAVSQMPISDQLWIVEMGRIRVRQSV